MGRKSKEVGKERKRTKKDASSVTIPRCACSREGESEHEKNPYPQRGPNFNHPPKATPPTPAARRAGTQAGLYWRSPPYERTEEEEHDYVIRGMDAMDVG